MADPARILVIDDNPEVLELLLDILQPHYAVETSPDALEAMGRLLKNPYDLLILDFALPLVDGREFLRIIRSTPSFEQLPILLISAYADVEQQIPPGAASAFLPKPFSVPTLLANVEEVLSRAAQN